MASTLSFSAFFPIQSSRKNSLSAVNSLSHLSTGFRQVCLRDKFKNVKFSCSSTLEPSQPNEDETGLAPVQPESPIGLLLTKLLEDHPHLFPAAAEQQLDELLSKEGVSDGTERDASGTEMVLYKRIAEVRESERRRAIEEVMYALIVQRFREAGAAMVPKVPFFSLDTISPFALMTTLSPTMDKELLSVHSEEAREMVKEHLVMIMGGKQPGPGGYPDDRVVVQTDKLRMGQVYAASIMYGYFLRRVDQRYQLEKTMASLAGEGNIWDAFQEVGEAGPVAGKATAGEAAVSPLRQYVMSFDPETLQKSAMLRSKEGLSMIERQTEALFGRPEVHISPDGGPAVARLEPVGVTLATLKRVVLEAVAFGSFLWDVETYVDTRHGISKAEL